MASFNSQKSTPILMVVLAGIVAQEKGAEELLVWRQDHLAHEAGALAVGRVEGKRLQRLRRVGIR